MYPLSRYALVLCIIVLTLTAFLFYPRWENKGSESTLAWDASGYYMYLPALFIYKDIKKCGFKDSILQKYQPTPDFQQAHFHEKSGNYVMKYSSGLAVVSLPFFIIGHVWASSSDAYLADGFSYPYQASIGIGLFLLSLIGIYFLHKVLLRYYKDKTVAILLVVYVIGTNYINYAAVDQAMTHSTLFTLYVLLLWTTIKFYDNLQWKWALAIGMICGLATLIRPTEIISVALPIFWGVTSLQGLNERLYFIKTNIAKYVVAVLAFGAIVALQPIYWKYATGEWIVYSYGDQGFSWLKPHIYDCTLSYRCGWLRFTSMMVLPFVGLWIFWKHKINHLVITGFILLCFYLVTAWDVWDYGGTAGRAMVQYYPILAFPFATLIESAETKKWYQYILNPGLVFLAYLNVWWVYHAHGGQVQALELSRAYYMAKVGRWTADEEDKKLLDNKHVFRGTIQNPVIVYENNFDSDTAFTYPEKDGNKQIRLNRETQFSPLFAVENQGQFKRWIRASATFHSTNKEWDLWRQTQFIVKFYNGDKEVQANMIRVHRFIGDGETKDLYLDAKLPTTFTKMEILWWHADSDKELWIDQLKVISFDP